MLFSFSIFLSDSKKKWIFFTSQIYCLAAHPFRSNISTELKKGEKEYGFFSDMGNYSVRAHKALFQLF